MWPINKTLLSVTTLDQSGPGSDGNVGIFRFPQSSSIATLSSDCLMSYPGNWLVGGLTSLQRRSRCILWGFTTTVLPIIYMCVCVCVCIMGNTVVITIKIDLNEYKTYRF